LKNRLSVLLNIEYKFVESRVFRYKDTTLHYYQHGSGVKTLVCFHGFGQNASFFKPLAEKLSSRYTVYAFDLFYHGESHWKHCELALSPSFLSEIMTAWLCHEGISCISLCGYSMGGKIALSLVETLKVPLEKLLLIAPDGIKTSFWYSMATYPYWARRLFRYTIKHPTLFLHAVSLLGKIKVLDKGVIRFAKSQMNSIGKRKKVYCTWLAYRKIKADIGKVARRLNDSGIELVIYLGKYDRIITKESINPLVRQVKNHELFTLDRGHNTLIEDVAREKSFNF
jgi:pimeloyl-ACP methyl ester carboxylesterase